MTCCLTAVSADNQQPPKPALCCNRGCPALAFSLVRVRMVSAFCAFLWPAVPTHCELYLATQWGRGLASTRFIWSIPLCNDSWDGIVGVSRLPSALSLHAPAAAPPLHSSSRLLDD